MNLVALDRPLWEDGGDEIHVFASQPFRFQQIVDYLSRSSDECLLSLRYNRIRKALAIGEETAVVEITSEDDSVIHVRFLGGTVPAHPEGKAAVARYVREWFDLDTDLHPFYRLAAGDRLLQTTVERFYGLRRVGIPDLFEAISWGIIGQQINLAFAYTLKRRLVEGFGRCVELEGEKYWIFPKAEDLAAITAEDLSSVRMTVKKCEYVLDIARRIAAGDLTKEKLMESGDDKLAEKRLVAIRGIGPWTAHYVLMRCLRTPSAFPIDDVGLHNSIKHLLSMDRKPTKEEILRLSAAWPQWESYATFYLWRVLY